MLNLVKSETGRVWHIPRPVLRPIHRGKCFCGAGFYGPLQQAEIPEPMSVVEGVCYNCLSAWFLKRKKVLIRPGYEVIQLP